MQQAFAEFLEQGVGIGLRRARFLIAIATGRKDFRTLSVFVTACSIPRRKKPMQIEIGS
jgi:hypothetical protein